MHISEGGSAADAGGLPAHFTAGIYERAVRHREDCGTEDVRELQPPVRHELHRRHADEPVRTERQLPPGEQPRAACDDKEDTPGKVPQRWRLGGRAQGHRPETGEHDEGRREEAGGRPVGREGHSRGAGTLRHNTGGCDAMGNWCSDEGVPLE